MTLEELKKEFEDNGFQIDGDSFVLEKVEYSTININGHVHQQPHKTRFEMKYIGDGSIKDAGDSEDSDVDVIYEFDVIGENNEPAITICISSFEDFTKIL